MSIPVNDWLEIRLAELNTEIIANPAITIPVIDKALLAFLGMIFQKECCGNSAIKTAKKSLSVSNLTRLARFALTSSCLYRTILAY